MRKEAVPAENKTPETSVPAVDNAFEILEFLRRNGRGASFTEICRSCSLPKSSCHRILASMSRRGVLDQNESTGLFTLGYRLLLLGRAAQQSSSLVKSALPFIQRLSSEIKETVKLSIRRDKEIHVVEKVESPLSMKITMDVGAVLPIHAGGASKLLLAHAPAALIEEVLAGELRAFTPRTITDPAELGKKLEEIRRKGFAEDEEEYIEGVGAVACPVFDYSGHVVAAVSVPYLVTRSNKERKRMFLSKLFEHARGISDALGHE